MLGFKRLVNNVNSLVNKNIKTLQSSDETTLTSLPWGANNNPEDKQAVFPNWFFSARLGQPRHVDTRMIRNLSQSPWVQMVINTFKKQVYTTDWKIVPIDEDDETDYTKDILKCEEFLDNINKNGQCIDDLNSEIVTDISEIDAGVWNFVYSNSSYNIGEVPIYDAWGRIQSTELSLVLKPLGQREIVAVKSVDGSSILKQVDLYKNILNYWQYSFKHPMQNPTRFENAELVYMLMNPRPYSLYGFSPVQSVQQVIELLIQGTRYNKDLYTNNAIPDVLISLPKLPTPELKKLKRLWNNEYQGKPHQVGFINAMIENVTKLAESNRDLEWLEGQKWYKKLIFGVFGVSPEEAGFTESSNRATGDSQERVTVRNALAPYYKLIENNITNRLLPEILQKEKPGLKFKFFPKDKEKDKLEFEQSMKELETGVMTINEYRRKNGKDEVEWGDKPLRQGFDPSEQSFTNSFTNPNLPNDNNKKFKKRFEVFLNDRKP